MAKLSFSQYQALQEKGLTEDQIAKLAEKHGYKMPSDNILSGAMKTLLIKPADRFAEAVGRTGILGENIKRGYEEMQKEGQGRVFSTGFGETMVEQQKGFGSGGGRQIAADALESASYLAPVGKMASAGTKLTGRALLSASAANAVSGYAADVSGNLREGKTGAEIFTPGGATAFSAALPFAGKALSKMGKPLKKVGSFATSHLTGLDPETVVTAIKNPTALSAAQREGLSRFGIAKQVEEAFKTKIDELSITGKKYQSLVKNNGNKEFQIPENTVKDILKKYGIKVENGALKMSKESVPLSQADQNALERFISQYGSETSATTNSFLNTRRALDQLAHWEQGKSDVSDAISRELRKAYDDAVGKAIPGLKELDAEYAPMAQELKDFRKYMFDKKGRLLDSGVNRIANATGLGKEKVLEKLEKLSPGIGQKLQLLKAMEDIGKVHKVGTYIRGGVATGAAFAGNVPLLVLSMVAGNPVTSIPILKAYGRLSGVGSDVVERVSKKLLTGSTLHAGDLMLIRKAVENHIAHLQSDKFDDEQDANTPQ